MKKLFFILGLTAALSVSASAKNGEQGVDQPEESESYTFSINSEFLSIFTLFCIREEQTDSIKAPEVRLLPLIESREEG
jgi:hypothetical protein